MIKEQKSSFFPIGSIQGKNNYKIFYKIEKDGTIVQHIFLNILDQRKREELVCLHFLKNYTKCFLNENIGINVINRDSPWDFKLELSTGEKFNLEITSIADSTKQFKNIKDADRLNKHINSKTIPLHELIKLNSLFGNLINDDSIKQYLKNKTPKDKLVRNPLKRSKHILISNHETNDSLKNYISIAIEKKIKKNHSCKEDTILIIDNRTSSFEVSDLSSALEKLEPDIDSYPFREIWFYTGYFSDNDGNNAEFTFSPIKIKDNQRVVLEKLINKDDAQGLNVYKINHN